MRFCSTKRQADLCAGIPDVGIGSHTGAVGTHMGLHDVLDHKALLKNGPVEHLALHCQLHLQPSRVRLCPDEACVHQFDLQTMMNSSCHVMIASLIHLRRTTMIRPDEVSLHRDDLQTIASLACYMMTSAFVSNRYSALQ